MALAQAQAADPHSVWVSSLEIRKMEQGYGHPGVNQSVGGTPLTIAGKTFEKGVGTHAVSDLFIDLGGNAEKFSAWVGVDDETKGAGKVEFVIMGDGKTLWKSDERKGGTPPVLAEANLKGVKLLQLHVGANEVGMEHADWAEAQILCNGASPKAVARPEPEALPLPLGWKRELPFNADWRFLRLDKPDAAQTGFETLGFDDSKWESVNLPHTSRIEKRDERYPFQGICWYRHAVNADPAWKGKRVSIQFGAAMQIAQVWVNGKPMTRHLGGYLPFSIDITDALRFDAPNAIAVCLDNRDTVECPPGTPTNNLDFNYPGGLYRGAQLIVTDPIHISDPLTARIEAGGGIFVQCHDVSPSKATVSVKTHVVNESPDLLPFCTVISILRDSKGNEVARHETLALTIPAGEGQAFQQEIELAVPNLWHPDHPSLYTLESQVHVTGRITDRIVTRIGIRSFTMGNRLRINGEEFHICGSNRHQEFPWIEYAASPNMAYRDAKKIREGGFNFIRLSHYPQDPAFLDACDELGILVQAPIPGWQFYSATSSFVKQSFQNLRDLIRRDRNHCSVLIWESNLNETTGKVSDHFERWQRTAHEIAHAEFPGPECFTFGDGYPDKAGWHWDTQGLAREYGDFGFGGNESTSRHLRGEGEKAMLQQAWNFQWCFNDLSKSYEKLDSPRMGSATWVMFDYNRGYYAKPCTCGMMDILRLPKFVYYFYQSQRDPKALRNDVESGPMLYIANEWTPRESPCKVVIYSNCDSVELSVNGKVIRNQKPDSGSDTKYSSQKEFSYATVGKDLNSSGGNPFDGGNAIHLAHPPFTFNDVPFEPGILKAVGYLSGKPVVERIVRTPGAPAALKLVFDTAGRELCADGADSVFARALVLDQNGTVVPENNVKVTWSIDGPARLVGPTSDNAEAGIASILVQAGLKSGPIKVSATAPGLPPASASIVSQPAR